MLVRAPAGSLIPSNLPVFSYIIISSVEQHEKKL